MTEISSFSPEYLKNKADYDYLTSSMENIKEKWKEIPFTKENIERNILDITNEMNYHITKINSKNKLDTIMFTDEIIMEKFRSSLQREIERKYQNYQKYQFYINRDNIEKIFASVQNEIPKSLDYYKVFTNILIQKIIMENPGFTYKLRLDLIYEFPHLPWMIGNQEFYLGPSVLNLLNDEFMSFFKKNINLDWNYIMFFKLIERTNTIPLFNRHFTYESIISMIQQSSKNEDLKLLHKITFTEACALNFHLIVRMGDSSISPMEFLNYENFAKDIDKKGLDALMSHPKFEFNSTFKELLKNWQNSQNEEFC